jgi:hypothetical protein
LKTAARLKINLESMEMHDRSGLKNRNFATMLDCIVIGTFLLVLNINCNLYASNFSENKADTCACRVEIVMLDSTNEAYFLYALIEKDSSQIVIVSLQDRNREGEKIKLGEKYTLQIKPYYYDNIFPNHAILFDIELSGKKLIVPSKGWASNLYTSPDLSGLRITPYCRSH